MKILKAEVSDRSRELINHQVLRLYNFAHRGYRYITVLRNSFAHEGPNGTHLCLIFGAMTATVEDRMRVRFSCGVVRDVVRCVLLGLEYSHSCDLLHGGGLLACLTHLLVDWQSWLTSVKDLRPCNLLVWDELPRDKILNEDVERLFPVASQQIISVRRRDRKPSGKHVPEYLVAVRPPPDPPAEMAAGFRVIVSDFGSSFPMVMPPAGQVLTPINLRSPESILRPRLTPKHDIWSIGCLVYSPYPIQPLESNPDDDNPI
jgi:non-specific serine/threonine protein kinase